MENKINIGFDGGAVRMAAFLRNVCESSINRLAFGILTVVLHSGFVYAGWDRIVENESGDIYVDAATIRPSGRRLTMVSLTDTNHRSAPTESETTWFKSVIQIDEYDCEGRRMRLKSFSLYSEAMGRGKRVSKSIEGTPWARVQEGSWNERKWRVVCRKSQTD